MYADVPYRTHHAPACTTLFLFSGISLDLVHQPANGFLGRSLHDSVTKIQQVSVTGTPGLVDAIPDGLFDLLLGSKEDCRVDVPTDGNVRAQNFSCFGHVDGPIDGNHVGPHVALEFQIGGSSVGKVNDRDFGVFLLDDGNSLLGGGFSKILKVLGVQLVGPALKELDDLGSAFDLVAGIVSDHGGNLVQEQVHGLVISTFVGHHEFLGVEAVLGGLALDCVRGQREGCSNKANECRVFLFGFL
mmetsp:Transcript_89/g.238  ORF Transcript_89/g.238 Transcript_89/m.238 type:complete len:244 (+) Transcript_89:210-941(+)